MGGTLTPKNPAPYICPCGYKKQEFGKITEDRSLPFVYFCKQG